MGYSWNVPNFNELDQIIKVIHKENRNAKKWHNMRFHMKKYTLCAGIYAQKEKSYNLGSNNLKTLVLNGRLFKWRGNYFNHNKFNPTFLYHSPTLQNSLNLVHFKNSDWFLTHILISAYYGLGCRRYLLDSHILVWFD